MCLVTSSGTIALAEAALKKDNRKAFKLWMVVTLTLGYIFVVLQSVEYYEAYAHMGLTLGAGIYGTTFFDDGISWISCLLGSDHSHNYDDKRFQRGF